MKTYFKDYLYSLTAILFILAISLLLVTLLKAALFRFLFVPSIIFFALFFPLYGLVTALYLTLLNRFVSFRSGTYSMTHSQFTLWKHYSVVGELGMSFLRFFFPVFLRPVFYSLWGAKIGGNVAIGGVITDPRLVSIHDYAIVGQDSVLTSHAMIHNELVLEPIIIGRRATVGVKAVIMPGVEIGHDAIVAPGAVVPMHTRIPPSELWGGVPAKKIKDIETGNEVETSMR